MGDAKREKEGAAMVPLVLTLAGNWMLVRVALFALFFLGPCAPELLSLIHI